MLDRKSTRLNSSHLGISYAVFCLKKKKRETTEGGWARSLWTRVAWISALLVTATTEMCIIPRLFSCLGSCCCFCFFFFFFNDAAPPEIYPLSLHDALPI